MAYFLETRLRIVWVLILKVPSDDFEGAGKDYKTHIFLSKSVDLGERKVKKGVVARNIAVLIARPAFYGGRRDLMTPFDVVMLVSGKRMFLKNGVVAQEITHFCACSVPQSARPPMR